MTPGLTEILIALAIMILLFGAKLAPGLGKSVTSSNAGMREEAEKEETNEESETGKKTS